MINRQDVIIDPTDPRVEGLIGKLVYVGDSFKHIQRAENINIYTTLKGITDGSDCFEDYAGYRYTMIAPIPEPTYRPYDNFNNSMVGRVVELKSYQSDKHDFEIVGMNIYNNKILLKSLSHGLIIQDTLKAIFGFYVCLDGTPFGIKE